MYPSAYIQFLVHFHGDRDYFECHEVLEEYWKEMNENKDSIWVGLIMLAVANYHHRRGNFGGALRMLLKAKYIFESNQGKISILGINDEELFKLIESQLKRIEKQLPYESYNLPIIDKNLIQKCSSSCEESGFEWCQPSKMDNLQLLNRHTLRDRSEVIEERKKALKKRKK